VPAPAVIPALVAYINTVVVKTLVVDPRAMSLDPVLIRSHAAPCYNGVVGNVVSALGICPHGFYSWAFRCGFLLVVRSLPTVRRW